MKLFRHGMIATVLAVGCVAFAEKDGATPVAVRCEGRIGREGYGAPNWWLERLNGRRRLVAESGGKYDLVMLGDSITHNFDMRRDDPGRPGPGHAALKEIERVHTVLNCGYSGDGYEHVLWRVRNGELEGVRAGTIMLLVGTNNRHGNPEETARGIRAILDELIVRQPQARILLLAIFPCGSSADDPGRRVNERVNEIIRSYADGSRVIWIDLREKFLDAQGDTEWIMPDRLHPTAKGYEDIWLPAILRHMQMELPLTGSAKSVGWDAEPFTVGDIRWDAWYGESEDKDETTAQEVIKTLSPERYHWRLPFLQRWGRTVPFALTAESLGSWSARSTLRPIMASTTGLSSSITRAFASIMAFRATFAPRTAAASGFCMILRLMEKTKVLDFREKLHAITHARNGLLTVEKVVGRLNKLTKGWGAFCSVGYPSKAFHAVNGYALRRMARFLNRKSQRRYRLKFADTCYGELNHYGVYWLKLADVRRRRN